jgi:sugar phosphate isomerase/epimerase
MFVACSTLCFAKLPLEETLRTIREMGFLKVDLAIHEMGPHLRPSEVVADAPRIAQKLRAANLQYAAFHLNFGDIPSNEMKAQLQSICRLARVMAVPLVTVMPATRGSDFASEVARLRDWIQVVEAEGLILTVETHSDTLTACPKIAIELCKQVPGLGLTLDPSHYQIQADGGVNYDPLMGYVQHVRLRDSGSKPDQFQVRIGQGQIEYGRIITHLDRHRYDRGLSVDVRDVPDNPFPIEPEVRKLKYLLESLN